MWLFPAAYAVHILEEALGGEGFGRWIGHVIHREIGPKKFLIGNAVLWLAMVAAVGLLGQGSHAIWLAAALGAVFTVNGAGHLVGTVVTRTYSPGLVSGVLLWVPLGLATLWWAWHSGSAAAWGAGILAGLAAQAALAVLALALSNPVPAAPAPPHASMR